MASQAVRAHARTGRNSTPRNTPSPRNTPPARSNPPSAPPEAVNRRPKYSIAQRVHCLVLQGEGFSWREIERRTGIKQPQQSNIKKKAFDRGFRPDVDPRILDYYVEDELRTGRPKKISLDTEQQLLANVRADKADKEKSSEVFVYKYDINLTSALRVLRKYGLTNVKPTRKSDLDKRQRLARLKFCLEHQYWTLEDWKRVIWSDETSIILDQRRDSVRIWRDLTKIYESTVIRRR